MASYFRNFRPFFRSSMSIFKKESACLALMNRTSKYFPMTRHYLYFLLLLMSFFSIASQGQTPARVSLCDLVSKPEKYSRQFVQVRGAIAIGFEYFTLRTHDCGEQLREIWLAYGGDEPTPITSTVNDRERGPGIVLKVGGIAVPLQRDATLELFKGRLMASRLSPPDGSMCSDDCRLYDVTATLTGLFMAAPNRPNNPLSGYGHLGCCHLLAIQQVTDVDVVRTEAPAGGKFTCSKETWEMDPAQAGEASKRRKCTDLLDCRKAVGEQFVYVAEHWVDKVDTHQGTALSFMTGAPTWRSADLLTTYALRPHYSDDRRWTGPLLGATATRTACTATEAPYPSATPIRCMVFSSDFHVPKGKAANAANSAKRGEDGAAEPEVVSRYALEEAAKLWGVALMPGITLEKCSKRTVFKDEQFTWCEWSEPTSMQSFSIQISRSHFLHKLRKWDGIPWTLSRGEGSACIAELP